MEGRKSTGVRAGQWGEGRGQREGEGSDSEQRKGRQDGSLGCADGQRTHNRRTRSTNECGDGRRRERGQSDHRQSRRARTRDERYR